MVRERIPAAEVDASILGTPLTFRNGRRAMNRFLKASLTEKISTWDPENLSKRGIPTQELINLYDKWGKGGFGVILTGNVLVEPRNLEGAGNAIICKENDSPELRRAFEEVAKFGKQDGSLILAQLSHAGRQTPAAINEHPFSCSDVQLVSHVTKTGKPIPLMLEQIKTEVVDRFVYAAKVVYETGFDGVQLHAAHGYLLSQFLSPTTNKRTDRYGGSLQNRIRIIVEIFQAIREEIPAETGFLVGIKTNSVEFQANGLTVEEAKEACAIMEECGFDFVELSGGNYEKLAFQHKRHSTQKREAFFLEFAEKIRPVFKKTIVYVTGGFRTAAGMVQAVNSGATDGIGLGRPITAEPVASFGSIAKRRVIEQRATLTPVRVDVSFCDFDRAHPNMTRLLQDLPLKILDGRCNAAADAKISQDDFMMTLYACSAQMGQMSKLPSHLTKNVCEGIADFSIPEEADNFKKALASFLPEMQKLIESNIPIYGAFPYENICRV